MKTIPKILFLLCLLLFLATDVFGQAGETGGPIVTIDMEPVCDDGTTVFHVLQFVVGEANPISLGYFDGQGNAYTPTGTPEAGSCDGSVAAGPDYTVSVLALCDDGTPFYRVAVFTDNTTAPTASADYELDLTTAYVPAGTVNVGPCNTSINATLSRTLATTTGTITAGAFSFEICNQGTEDGTVTINAVTTTLIPGSCTSYAATYNPATRQYRTAPEVSYDGTGTTLSVVVEN
jgi:hypothetical protein